MIYLFLFILLIFSVAVHSSYNNKSKPIYWMLFVVLTMTAGFRFQVGIDTLFYTTEFDNFPTLFTLSTKFISESNYQPLWIIFESTLRTFSESFYFVQIVLAIFVNYSVFSFAKRYCYNPFLFILFYYLIFYLNLNMEIMRESIPLCLFLWLVPLLESKKYVRYCLVVVFGYFFHESAAVLLLVPFIWSLRLNKFFYFVTIVVVFILAEALNQILNTNLDLLTVFFKVNKFDYLEVTDVKLSNYIFHILKFVFFPSLILYFFFESLRKFEKNMILMYIVFSIFSLHMFIFYRFRDYFFLFFLLAFLNGLHNKYYYKTNLNVELNRFSRLVFLFLFLFNYLYRYYYVPDQKYQIYLNYYPYKSILDEELPESRKNNAYHVLN